MNVVQPSMIRFAGNDADPFNSFVEMGNRYPKNASVPLLVLRPASNSVVNPRKLFTDEKQHDDGVGDTLQADVVSKRPQPPSPPKSPPSRGRSPRVSLSNVEIESQAIRSASAHSSSNVVTEADRTRDGQTDPDEGQEVAL